MKWVPRILFFFFVGGAVGLAIELLGLGSCDGEPKVAILPTNPAIQTVVDCSSLRTEVETLAPDCIDDIGEEAWLAEEQYWEDLVYSGDVTPEEAADAFFDWMASQSETCKKWKQISDTLDMNCP